MDMLSEALKYYKAGCSVIPIQPGKKIPLVKWERYQKERADEKRIQQWWTKNPNANIGLVTGKLSGIYVIDVDTDEGREAIAEYLSDSLETPSCITPGGGEHLYFASDDPIPNNTRAIPGCDFRGEGGYVVAPPSVNGSGKKYAWKDGLSFFDVELALLPECYIDSISIRNNIIEKRIYSTVSPPNNNICTNNNIYTTNNIYTKGGNIAQQSVTKRNIMFEYGRRDNDLFHTANCLVKGGMPEQEIIQVLEKLILSWGETPDPKWINAKVQSALKREANREINLTQSIRDWVGVTWGNISVTSYIKAQQSVTFVTPQFRNKCRVIFGRLVKEGLLERIPDKDGWYRHVDNTCEDIDFRIAGEEPFDIWLPFGLHEMVEIMPGNIILIAGEPNVGKSCFMLNVIRENMYKHKVYYFTSEMGGSELKKRLRKFDDMSLDDWQFEAKSRSADFAQVIHPDRGAINIIDYLEIYENFYEIGSHLAAIHEKLGDAIAIVAIQKSKGIDTGRGGAFTLEKPRLALAMSPGILKIVKAKNWKGIDNPNGKVVKFRIVQGSTLIQQTLWARED